ncbi:response regulator [Brunnivagina elsteri]|uniref:Protein PatA n=1 Tax=Brunnivagina elsteri CCALA 953 TaxID=987040 RepID=A0A2A2TH67_9CYAN|nr:response regulator [Calothrix elsteri]PAX52749.1 two-component system response regulator [Calothrix elsteri CCALA 953]
MQTIPIGRYRFFQRIQPLFILNQVTSTPKTGCLQVYSASISWLIYFEKGKLVYASYSDRAFDLLYKKLKLFSKHIPTLNQETYQKLRAIFETAIDNQAIPSPDYLAICWLVNQKYLSFNQAKILVEEISLEVLDTFLHLKEGSYEFTGGSFIDKMPKFCYLDVNSLVEKCQEKTTNDYQNYSTQEKSQQSAESRNYATNDVKSESESAKKDVDGNNNRDESRQANDKQIYKVMCIDDSPTVINAIKYFLDDSFFEVVGINDPLKALMLTIRVKPDLILLDIGMPNLNGYELCSLLRRHSYFRNTPVIMVTARTSFIDRAKAKMVRSSGYLTKPFTQADLLKIIFHHLEV